MKQNFNLPAQLLDLRSGFSLGKQTVASLVQELIAVLEPCFT